MAKHKKEEEGKETVEFFQELDRENLKTEKFLERNAKYFVAFFVVVITGILGYFAYQQFVIAPKNEEAAKGFFAAQKNLESDKTAEALGGKSAANPGFLGTYKEFGDTQVGKLAAFNAASLKFKEGKYQEAFDLFNGFSSKNDILMALKYGAMADCKVNLNKNDEASSLFEQAISASKDAYTSYYFTRKAGILAISNNKKQEAKKYFSTIEEKYSDYDNGMSDVYIEMVKNF